jgi:type IV pilus assembly protein PilP
MKKIIIIISLSLLISVMAISAAICADVKNDLQPFPADKSVAVEIKPQSPSTPPAFPTSENMYNYNPLGKPDPFRPFVELEIAAKKKEEKDKKETPSIFPLQRVDVENFKVVGIAGDEVRRVAIVQDATKKFYPLFLGTRIGLHNGKVQDILADRVVVDELQGKKAKRIILKLRKN